MTLEIRVIAVGNSIRDLVARLNKCGFRFEHPDAVFPGPERHVTAAIARIERNVGTLPLALKLFWTHVGSVDLCGYHPDWEGCDYPDPLVVYPPAVAIQELEEFLADKKVRSRQNFPYLLPIAPDSVHKAGDSGGMWYNLSVPAVADDPPLNAECHRTTFMAYLELAVKWACFPGLSRSPGHSWPVSQLVCGNEPTNQE
jgi:hypothetical protein